MDIYYLYGERGESDEKMSLGHRRGCTLFLNYWHQERTFNSAGLLIPNYACPSKHNSVDTFNLHGTPFQLYKKQLNLKYLVMGRISTLLNVRANLFFMRWGSFGLRIVDAIGYVWKLDARCIPQWMTSNSGTQAPECWFCWFKKVRYFPPRPPPPPLTKFSVEINA